MKINAERLWQRLMTMAQIGAIPGDGVNRQALSKQEAESWRLMLHWAQSSDLAMCSDEAGNLFVILPGSDRQAAPLLLGSHLDSQPTGGRFDGVYGVLGGAGGAGGVTRRQHPARLRGGSGILDE